MRQSAEERFWSNVEPDYKDCWLWRGKAIATGGYAQFFDRRRVYAHRWAYEHLVGPIPEGLVLDHLCRVRLCVNPDHLEPVTQKENARRGLVRHYCKRGHPLIDGNLYVNGRRGRRQCRSCVLENARRRYRLQKEPG